MNIFHNLVCKSLNIGIMKWRNEKKSTFQFLKLKCITLSDENVLAK